VPLCLAAACALGGWGAVARYMSTFTSASVVEVRKGFSAPRGCSAPLPNLFSYTEPGADPSTAVIVTPSTNCVHMLCRCTRGQGLRVWVWAGGRGGGGGQLRAPCVALRCAHALAAGASLCVWICGCTCACSDVPTLITIGGTAYFAVLNVAKSTVSTTPCGEPVESDM
jgi:hypothetical protein